jgi:hypothetical protein
MDREALLWQLGLTFELFELFVAGLDDEEALREPAAGAWSVHQDSAGRWTADWAQPEPDPAPPTSVAWLLWHIGWWWADTTGRAFGAGPVDRSDAPWPGAVAVAVAHIRRCHDQWRKGLMGLSAEDLGSTAYGDRCWPDAGRPFSHVAAWVNSELMKNTAEIGATRRILGAG